MRRIRFGIRSILVLATVVAVFMFVMNEWQRYSREHVFITVLDAANGVQISEFQYRTWVITKESGVAPEWSQWSKQKNARVSSIKVPANCKLFIEVQAIGFPIGQHVEKESMLVSPELSHQFTLRIKGAFRVTGIIVDEKSGKPIERVVVAPMSRMGVQRFDIESTTDSQGRYLLYSDKPNEELFAFHPRYQYRFAQSASSTSIALKSGQSVRGRVVERESGDPIRDCEVEVKYGTGVPLTLDKLPQGDMAFDDGTPAVLRSKSPPRTTRTDANGLFELFMEPLALNTKLHFQKDGWYEAYQSACDPQINRVELHRSEYQLEGTVTDEQGNPISQFNLSTVRYGGNGLMGMGETQTDSSIEAVDGHFRVFATKPFLGFSIRSDGYAPVRRGFQNSEYKAKPLVTPFNETIRLTKGVRVSGAIEKAKSHSRSVSVYLTDLRSCNSLQDLTPPNANHLYAEDGEITDKISRPWVQYESRTGSDGRYTFEGIAAGRYALHVLYGDQTVALKPIEVGNESIDLPKIQLPAFGRLQGILKERIGLSGNPSTLETKINPFAIYYLNRAGDPFGVPFRTDHRGEFSIEQTLVGKVKIGTRGSEYISWDREIAAYPQFVRDGTTSTVSDDSAVLCVLLTDEIDKSIFELDPEKAFLHGAEESEAWLEPDSELSRDGFRKYRVLGRIDLPSGIYTVEIKNGPISVTLDFEYRRNQAPMTKLLLYRRVSALVGRGRSGSMGGAKAMLIRNGRTDSQFYIPFDSTYLASCLVESSGPFDMLIDDYSNGYALLKNISFSNEMIKLGTIPWQLGASVSVDVSLNGLDIFPDKVSIRHEQTGVVYSEDHNWNYEAEFSNLMPGKWTVEVTGADPLVGTKILLKRTIVLNQSEDVRVEMRKTD